MATIDDVHKLLKAVNEVTLKRMEDKTDAINQVTLKRMEDLINAINQVTLKRIEDLINAVNQVTLKRIEDLINAVNQVTLKRMEDKVDAVNEVTLKRMEDLSSTSKAVCRNTADAGTIASPVNALAVVTRRLPLDDDFVFRCPQAPVEVTRPEG